jgi:multicomponent Na+:H+ antiporter subunit B
MLKRVLIILGLLGLCVVFLDLIREFESPDALLPVAEQYVARGPAEIGAANLVTAVVVTYRGLDTLGEVTVLFIAATGVGLMLKRREHHDVPKKRTASELVQTGSLFLVSLIMLFGVYIFVNGHLSPGGGFQGGAVIASGMLLLLLSNPHQELDHKVISVIESLSGVVYVTLGTVGLFWAGGFLDNNIFGLGAFGLLFSAGIIPLIYVCVGMKVGAELSGVLKHLQEV